MILEGRSVRLEPLTLDHVPALCEIAFDPELWRWMPTFVGTPDEMRGWVEAALRDQAAGTAEPFATVDLASGRLAGSTRYMNIDRANRRLEIGSTWLARPWQRTAINSEAKYLMLRHAFESLGCIRVELKTDSLNQQSRAAIERLGTHFEGIFRNHMICYGGRIRHTAWYSITDAEWPEMKARLEAKISSFSAAKT